MAINFTTFFTVIGKHIKSLNTLFGFLTQITTGLSDIETVLEANTLNRLSVQLHPTFEQMKRDVEGWTDDIINELRSVVITDRAFVRDKLVLQNLDFDSIMQEIINEMLSQTQSVDNSAPAPGAFSADGSYFTGKNTVTLLVFSGVTSLDGVTPPLPGLPASRHYEDSVYQAEENQFLIPTSMFLECVTAPSDGLETMRWISLDPQTEPYRDQAESPGIGPTFPMIQTENSIDNEASELDTYVNNSPVGWNVTTTTGAVAGTDYSEYGVAFRGSWSLVVKGDEGGGPHTITLNKDIPDLEPGKRYFFAAKVSNSVLAADKVNSKVATQNDVFTFTITAEKKDGTTFTATSSLNLDANPDKWESLWIDFVVPFNLKPGTTKISIKIDPFGTDWTLIDEITLSPARQFNGIGYAVGRGKLAHRLEVGDTGTVQNWTNSDDGVFQVFFRKAFGYQLPTDDSETILDTLAT